MATDYFNDAKPNYVEKIYAEAQSLLDAEKFKDAELLLTEVKRLQPRLWEYAGYAIDFQMRTLLQASQAVHGCRPVP